jgi:ADP-heptose:LPS heptosyltransferase
MIRVLVGLRYRFSRDAALQSKVLLDQIRSVLLLRLDEIGDVVLTTPLLRELRRNMPHAWITLVVKPGVLNLVELCPHVNEILTFDSQGTGLMEPIQRYSRALALAWRLLRKRRFELAVLPRWDIDWYHGTFLSYFSGAPRRVGYSEDVTTVKKEFNRGFDMMLTHVLRDNRIKHEVRHNLSVIEALGGKIREDHLELWISADDEQFADKLLRKHAVSPDSLLVAIGPGAGAPKRQWPLESYGQIGEWLQDQYKARVIIIGGADDQFMGRELQNKLGHLALDATGKTTLRQTAALLRRCTFYIGNDAGPMHIAAAAKIPVIELSCHPKDGSNQSANSPHRFAPWGTKSVVIQPENPREPCSDECGAATAHCILDITVNQVKADLTRIVSREEFISRRQRGETIGLKRV